MSVLYAVCWVSTFFLKSFDSTERFFAIPLAVFLFPLLFSLNIKGGLTFFRRSPIVWAVLALCIAVIVSIVLSPLPDHRAYRHILATWVIFFTAGFAIKLALPHMALRLMLGAAISGVLMSGIIGVAGVGAGLWESERLFLGPRLTLFFIHPNYLGLYCGLAVAALFYGLRCQKPIFTRSIDSMFLIILVLMLWETESRASIIACAAAMILTLILGSSTPLRNIRAAGIACLLLFAALFLAGSYTSLGQHSAYQKITHTFAGPMKDPGIAGRVMIWEIALRNAAERPFTGWGFRTYPTLHDSYLAKHTPELMEQYGFVEPNVRHAHNLFVGSLAELGVLGTIPLFFCFLWVFGQRGSVPATDGQLLKIVFAYLFLQELMEYILERVFFSNLFFAGLGILLACLFLESSRQPGTPEDAAQMRES